MANREQVIVIDDASSDDAGTPAKSSAAVPFEVVARGAGSTIFGKRPRWNAAAAGASQPCKARKGGTDAAKEFRGAASPSIPIMNQADASPGTASAAARDGPARRPAQAAPDGVSTGEECLGAGCAEAFEQAPAQTAAVGGLGGPAGADDVKVKMESGIGHWERDADANRKWVHAQAVSGPIAEKAAGNNDSARVLSYNKKEGREKSKLKPAALAGLPQVLF
jgi:hypothetical protein